MRIIQSILDTDLYKLTMGYVAFSIFPKLKVRYKFTDRNKLSYPDGFDQKIKDQLELMRDLALTMGERDFLQKMCGSFLPPTYIDFLKGFRYDPSEISVSLDKDNKLKVDIEGYWYRTILWEVVLMALISELYFIETGQEVNIHDPKIVENDIKKAESLTSHNTYYADFGTRRRYSFDNQDRVVKILKDNSGSNFVGSSNVYLCYKHNIKPIGTTAHEMVMVHAAIYGYKMANQMTMENWVKVYQGDLGITLTDTFTTEEFMKSFNSKYAKLFDGVRQDSGDPYEFADKFIEKYKLEGIDPMSKVIVFSDSLNDEKANNIKEYCAGKIKSSFGIGTFLTNDVGVKPLNMVIKVYQVLVNGEWANCVKISDNTSKNTGDPDEVKLCKQTLKIS